MKRPQYPLQPELEKAEGGSSAGQPPLLALRPDPPDLPPDLLGFQLADGRSWDFSASLIQ